MAYFNVENPTSSNRVVSLTTAIIAFPLILSRPSPVVAATIRETVNILCSRTLETQACKICILSDKSVDSAHVPQLTYSILYCVYSQVMYGLEHAAELAQKNPEGHFKQALVYCSPSFNRASNDLLDTLLMLEGVNYQGAYGNMKRSERTVLTCEIAFQKLGGSTPIPQTILHDLTLAKRLYDVADYFFHLFLKNPPNP